ncbi:MAG: hypothetical protein ACREGG_01010 [Candidatus Saccharimonadales bacterium]
MQDHELHQKEVVCTTFLRIASRDLKEGRYLHALTIFKALAKIDFTHKNIALQGEAVALARMGQFKEGLKEAQKKLQTIIEMSPEPTVFRADNLVSLGEVSVALQEFEDVEPILKEAAEIYDHQGLTKAHGSVVHLQSIVALWDEDYQTAIDQLTWATALSEIKIPEIVPAGFGIEGVTEAAMTEPAGLLALTGTRS